VKRWKKKAIVSGIMAVVGIVSVALGIHFNLHFGLIIVGNVWIVGAILAIWMQQ